MKTAERGAFLARRILLATGVEDLMPPIEGFAECWGKSVLQLIDLLGPDNVHLSIYEDNPSEAALQSLASFRHNVTCKTNHRLRMENS